MKNFDLDADNINTIFNRQPDKTSEEQSEKDLVSLANAHSAPLRCLAIKNIRYYPEHISILFSVLSSETDHTVLSEIEKSMESLASSADLKEVLLERLYVIIDTFSEGEPALTSCKRMIKSLREI